MHGLSPEKKCSLKIIHQYKLKIRIEHFSYFIYQLQDIVPQSLLESYLGMADPSRAQTVDTEITRHCAYNLPAVAYTLGRKNWNCIKLLYETLASDMQVCFVKHTTELSLNMWYHIFSETDILKPNHDTTRVNLYQLVILILIKSKMINAVLFRNFRFFVHYLYISDERCTLESLWFFFELVVTRASGSFPADFLNWLWFSR